MEVTGRGREAVENRRLPEELQRDLSAYDAAVLVWTFLLEVNRETEEEQR